VFDVELVGLGIHLLTLGVADLVENSGRLDTFESRFRWEGGMRINHSLDD